MTYDPLLRDIRLRIRGVMTTSGSYIDVKVYDNYGNLIGRLAYNRDGSLLQNTYHSSLADRFLDSFVDAVRRELERRRLVFTS